jgi:8-oxo-dGTP pyrophosphatase MutT (NUDIX family)
VFPLDVSYTYELRPELADRWEEVYGPDVGSVTVVAFGAEIADGVDPTLDRAEHDDFAWLGYDEAIALLDWPIEQDALHARRDALHTLARRLADDEN